MCVLFSISNKVSNHGIIPSLASHSLFDGPCPRFYHARRHQFIKPNRAHDVHVLRGETGDGVMQDEDSVADSGSSERVATWDLGIPSSFNGSPGWAGELCPSRSKAGT